MSVTDHVPGMRVGRTGRNAALTVLYLGVLSVLLVLLVLVGPALVAAAVGWNYRNAADRLAFLPGVSPDGGVKPALVTLVGGYVLVGVVVSLAGDPGPEDSDPSGTALTTTTESDSVSGTSAHTTAASPQTTSTTATPTTATTTATTTTPTATTTTTAPTTTTTTTTTTTISKGELSVARINEDAPDNDHENENGEYVVFENVGGKTLDLSGWRVEDDAGHTYHFPSEFTLGPGETVTLYTGSGTDSASELYWGSDAAVWNNGGDTVYVLNSDGTTVLAREYE